MAIKTSGWVTKTAGGKLQTKASIARANGTSTPSTSSTKTTTPEVWSTTAKVGISGVNKTTWPKGNVSYSTASGSSYSNLASALRANANETRKSGTTTTTTPDAKRVDTTVSTNPNVNKKITAGIVSTTDKRKESNNKLNALIDWDTPITESDITSAFDGLDGPLDNLYKNTVLKRIIRQTWAANIQEAVDSINAGKNPAPLNPKKDTVPEESEIPAVQKLYDKAADQKDDVDQLNEDYTTQLTQNADTLANDIQSSFWEQADIIRKRWALASETLSNLNSRIQQLATATNNYQDAGVSQRATALTQKMAAEWLLSGDQAQALSATLISDQTAIANLEKLKIGKEIAQMQMDAMEEYDKQRDIILQQEWVNENAKLQALDGLKKYYGEIIKRSQDFANANLQDYNKTVLSPDATVAWGAAWGAANAEASRQQFSSSPQEIYTDPDVRYSELYKKIRDDKSISGLAPYALEYLGTLKNTSWFLAKDMATLFSDVVWHARAMQTADAKSMK